MFDSDTLKTLRAISEASPSLPALRISGNWPIEGLPITK